MSIDITAVKTAITAVKTNINNCFDLCDQKGSTYSQTGNTTSELYKKIQAITAGGAGGVSSVGQPFIGFNVTASSETEISVDCGSIGASWKGIVVYSESKKGFFSIYKIDSTRCIVSGFPWYYYDDGSTVGEFPYTLESTSAMCNYTVSGSTINLSVIVYGFESPADISTLSSQVDTNSNYMLDLIDII